MRAKGANPSPGSRSSIIRRESSGKRLIEQSRTRLFCIAAFFFLSYVTISLRLVEIMLIHSPVETDTASIPADKGDEQALEESAAPLKLARGDIVDRNGVVLATTLSTESLFADPRDLSDPRDTARKLARTFPDLDEADLAKKLAGDGSFVWIKRNLTPREQRAANNLGIPGLYFQPEQKRVYPFGSLFSHVLGFVGVDHKGLAGIERYFDERLHDTEANKEPLQVSLDMRIQNIVHEELKEGMQNFGAIGATGIVLDLHSGEVLALSNLPDFDPHQAGNATESARFNRATLGTYEMGSTFKTFTIATALDDGVANLNDSFDATHPIQYSRFTIHDAEPKNRWLTVPEIYCYSSNIGTVRIAMDIGAERQQEFLRKIGLMEPLKIELPAPELGQPHYPDADDWHEINTMTIAYGHGMSVTPLHLMRAFSSIVNGGTLEPMTLVKDGNAEKPLGPRVVSEKTARQMRRLMRMVVEFGTARKAEVAGYRVGGKTGTAEKSLGGGYSHSAKLALFVSAFPIDNPRYAILVMIDEPKGNKQTFGFATGGWIAAPVVSNIIARMAPMEGIRPVFDVMPEDSVNRYWVNNANQKFLHAVSY
jgi:cell division protein FtsI (penicillin-binding protein 3)